MALKDQTRKKFSMSKVFGKKEKNAVRKSEESNLSSANFGGSTVHSPFSSPRIFKTLTDSNIFSDCGSPKHGSVHTEAFRIFVATWNVGGNPPHPGLDLNDFLPSDDISDIYVLGFQEIVPLNAGSVLVEDNEPAMKWLALINEALNRPPNPNADPSVSPYNYHNSSFSKSNFPHSSLTTLLSLNSGSNSPNSSTSRCSIKEAKRSLNISHGIRLKSCNCPMGVMQRTNRQSCFLCKRPSMNVSDSSEEEGGDEGSTSFTANDLDLSNDWGHNEKYCLVASKQMVGIFLSVWVRKELVPHIGHVRLSSVGRGIMNYLGNKGCISVSMSLHQTNICFVCSHLASGEKEGDELRRNMDVVEILKHTQFKRICKKSGRRIPRKILDHDRVIWLGDLNYRIALSYAETKQLVDENNWDALFENDQLKIEREAGRVFIGWNEGKIYFAPTYKYSNNSDEYMGDMVTSKKKRRTPAWCDRILWQGEGITQLSYFRGESRFSDHRPVCAAFRVEADVLDSKLRKHLSTPNMKVEAEELLP